MLRGSGWGEVREDHNEGIFRHAVGIWVGHREGHTEGSWGGGREDHA